METYSVVRFRFLAPIAAAIWTGCWIGAVARGVAQEEQPAPAPAARVAVAAPKDVSLTTKDDVALQATYYPGNAAEGKDNVPVILLHGFKGSKTAYKELAPLLQSIGCSVLVPDLRGHGQSVKGTDAAGNTVTLDAAKFRKDQFDRMVAFDMETLKGYLMERNNEGAVNIDKLCVVGAEMGAWVATNWAALDWSWQVVNGGKQGQDVKALALLSPEWQFQPKGVSVALPVDKAMRTDAVRQKISLMFLVGGQNRKAREEAKKVYNTVEKFHPKPDPNPEIRKETQDLFFIDLPTKLQGTEMLTVPELNAGQIIATFIKCRLIEKKMPWKKRG